MWIILVLLLFIVSWIFLKHIYSYWKRKGFPYIKPHIPFGNLDLVCKGKKSFGLAIYDLYQSTKEPFIGIYLLFRPAILIRDAELAKQILTKDFASFHDRGIFSSESDPISQNLFSLPGNSWKSLRGKLTPAFSSGKLKSMFEITQNVAKTMTDYLNFIVPADKETIIDFRDITNRYAVDIIANVIFGLEVNSFAEPKNPFRKVTEKTNALNLLTKLRSVGVFLCPALFKFLPFSSVDPYVKNFMMDIVRKTITYREKTNYTRKDLIQLLIQLRNTGKLNLDDELWEVETVSENLKSMSIEVCAAQLFLFYIAGSETTSLTTAFCLYELTQNQDVMRKVIEDIEQTIEKHNGQITYDSIQDMKYLELCVQETLRKYPGLPILNRECTENYQIPGTKYVIEKGTPIIISLLGMQADAENFPEPEKFDPERFSDKKEKDYKEAAFMPFGNGPRACIAFRMGQINVKVALVMLLLKYTFKSTESEKLEFANHSVVVLPKDGIKLVITRRKQNFTNKIKNNNIEK